MKLILSLLLITSISQAKTSCDFTINPSSVALSWTAFKTAKKVGVTGSFTDIKFTKTPKKAGKKLASYLEGVEFTIDSQKLSTNNKDRDKKIANFFFGKMSGPQINGVIKEVKKKTIYTEITVNGHTQIVPLSLTNKGQDYTATGTIDVFDFSLHESLKGINKACYELHEGKTWNDVDVSLTFTTTCQ